MANSPADNSANMTNKPVTDELIMKITKEVIVKFIEVGRLSPPKFSETFMEVHNTIKEAAKRDWLVSDYSQVLFLF